MQTKLYHPDWRKVIVPTILKRDHYKCKHCGISHKARAKQGVKGKYIELDAFAESWVLSQGGKVVTVFLAVAHLDHDKSNNNGANLLSLCPKCHTSYDAQHVSLLKKYLLSTHTNKIKPNKTKLETIYDNCGSDVKSLIYEEYNTRITTYTVKEIINLIINTVKNVSK